MLQLEDQTSVGDSFPYFLFILIFSAEDAEGRVRELIAFSVTAAVNTLPR